MEACGFTSYEYEWWHFDFGNVFWSCEVKRPVIFGPLFGDEEWPIRIKNHLCELTLQANIVATINS